MEYLASGRPVVSVPIPQVQALAGALVSFAATPEEFLAAIRRELGTDTPERVGSRQALARSHDWSAQCRGTLAYSHRLRGFAMTGARLRIAAVGDVMCGESFYQYGCGPRSQIDRLGADFFDPEIVAFLRSHHLVFANLECVLSDAGYNPRSLRSHQNARTPRGRRAAS